MKNRYSFDKLTKNGTQMCPVEAQSHLLQQCVDSTLDCINAEMEFFYLSAAT